MPELPDVAVYIEALEARIVGHRLERILLKNPFLLRTAEPPLHICEGRTVTGLRRVGKRIAIGFDNDEGRQKSRLLPAVSKGPRPLSTREPWLLIHLMIAGRLHWYPKDHRGRMRAPLLQLNFDNGVLTLTEAGTKRRASLHVVTGEAQLGEHDRGGLEVLGVAPERFRERLNERNHTLKRALTDPTLLSGIGNAYSDEILHRARLSPMKQTKQLDEEEWHRLYDATQTVLTEWIERLRAEAAVGFPENVTAFRKEMAVHGRYGLPCPVCGTAIQRIRYAENETNYCPRCQTEGKLLADRALSRLLKDDWPRTVEAWENLKKG